jgi:hypothetical protein
MDSITSAKYRSMPSCWEINSNDGTTVTAYNSKLQESFSGTAAAFKDLLTKAANASQPGVSFKVDDTGNIVDLVSAGGSPAMMLTAQLDTNGNPTGAILANANVLSVLNANSANTAYFNYDANGNLIGLETADGVAVSGAAPAYTWAGKPTAAAGNAGTIIRITNIGTSSFGSLWQSNGTRWYPLNGHLTLNEISAPIVSNGTTTNTVLNAVLIRAGSFQNGDVIEVYPFLTKSNTSDTNTSQMYIGTSSSTIGTNLNISMAQPATTNLEATPVWRLKRLSATSVKAITIGGATGLGSSAVVHAAVTVPNMDTQDTYLQMSAQMSTGGLATVQLDSMVMLLKAFV